MDLSVIIPARNEEFLKRTVDSVLDKTEANTEVIALLDGYWPDPPIPDREGLTIVHFVNPVGQRGGVNRGVDLSRADYIMKLDGHCDVDQGFDKKLLEVGKYHTTVIPRMYNLHAFDWECKGCGWRTYQGPYPETCEECEGKEFDKSVVWKKREKRYTDFWMFDKDLRFQYWNAYKTRPEAKSIVAETMSNIGACFFMNRERFLELGGLDEAHGSWGQVGTEVSCKTWLSGGNQVVYKDTWFAHMFRTRNGFSFPYKISKGDQDRAREYSKSLWLGGKWNKQIYPVEWLVSKFGPVPTWDDPGLTIIYYTANKVDYQVGERVRKNIKDTTHRFPLISVSQKPLDFGENICVGEIGQSLQNVYKQVLEGAKRATTDYVALVEDDCLYSFEHFRYRPALDTFAYNENRWNLKLNKPIFYFRKRPVLSQCIAPRKLLIETLEARMGLEEIPDKYCGEMGLYEKHLGLPEVKYERFYSNIPNIVLCHDNDTSGRKIVTKDTKDELKHWGKAVHVVNSVKGVTEGMGLKWRRQKSRIAGDVGYSVDELYKRRLDIIEPGKQTLKIFYPAFEEFVDGLIDGKELSDDEIRETPYYRYLLTKLNPADRNPYTRKGLKHVLNKYKNAIELFKDIKKNGLLSPLTFYKINETDIVIFRGARRLIILYKLGIKTAPLRIFKSKDDIRRYDNVPDKWHKYSGVKNSLHNLGRDQFKKLGGRSTDKYWIHDYLKIYDGLFGELRRKRIKILELGLLFGASLALWHKGFPKALIYGLDKNVTTWNRYIKGLDRIKVFVGKQDDVEFLKNDVIPHGPFHIIIDDCGHVPEAQAVSFEHLWPRVAPRGFYVIEDCWHSFERDGIKITDKFFEFIPDIYTGKILSVQYFYNLCIIQKGL